MTRKEPPAERRKRLLRQSETGQSAPGRCAICGKTGQRTKTHIPPQAAGNRADLSMRRTWLTVDQQLTFGRPLSGGIWLFLLCKSCNQAAGRFDMTYRDFADAVRPGLPRRVTAPAGYRWRPTDSVIRPGAVARAVLSGMFALNQSLRERHEALAEMLRDPSSTATPLPSEVRLRLAAFDGPRARVTGAYGGWYLRLAAGQRSDGVSTAASIYFPPLAWHLAFPEVPESNEATVFRPLLDIEGWPDVSDWVATAPDVAVSVRDCISGSLPVVGLPDAHPQDGARWIWLLSSEICPIIDANVTW